MDFCPVCQAQISKATGLCPVCSAPKRPDPWEESAAPAPISTGGGLLKGLTFLGMLVLALFSAYIAGKGYTLNELSAMMAPSPPPPPPAPAPTPEWRVSGRAYGLLNLKSISRVKIAFTHAATGEVIRAETDKEGNFEVVLPPVADGGYQVSLARRGYDRNYLEEMEPPYHAQSTERRRDALELMRQSALLHVPIILKSKRESLQYDLVLIPREAEAP